MKNFGKYFINIWDSSCQKVQNWTERTPISSVEQERPSADTVGHTLLSW